jgi:hypothetical protein
LIRELAHAAKHLGWRGTDIAADIGDFVELGAGPLIDEIISAFGLSDGAIAWSAGADVQQNAAKVLQFWRSQEGR